MQLSALVAVLPLAVSAAQIPVSVSNAAGELAFDPDSVDASAGDQVVFTFWPKAHSVSQSTFDSPCEQMAGGINSGIVPVQSGTGGTFTVTVNDTNPIWLYCAQNTGQHCKNGMVMVINEPDGPNTLDAYAAAAAKRTSNSTIGTTMAGGVLALNSTASSGANGTSTTTAGAGGSGATSSSTASASSSSSSGAAAAVATVAEWAVMGGAAIFGGLLI